MKLENNTLMVLIFARTNFRAISRKGPKMREIMYRNYEQSTSARKLIPYFETVFSDPGTHYSITKKTQNMIFCFITV